MKILFVLGLIVLALATALSTGWDLMFRLAYSMLGIVLVSFVWAWGNVRWLRFRYDLKANRAQVGGQIEEELTLENSSWLPKLWLEIRHSSTLPGHRGNRVVALRSYGKRVFDLATPCRKRGEYRVGPVVVASGDPFGLFRRQRKLAVGRKVIVYPEVTRLHSFGRLGGDLPGGNRQRQRTHFTTPNAAGVRDYQPGDALRRIHWPTSVRQGRLMVKEFELDPVSDVWVILDLRSEVQLGTGDDSTEEWVVKVGATLASYFVDRDREVGIITQGRILPPDRGHRQLHKVLELLAVVRSDSNAPLEETVAAEALRFARGATAVIVTPATDERWLDACKLLEVRGVNMMAVLLDAATFGARQSSLLLVSSLAVSEIPTYIVKKGDDLARALAMPGLHL